MQKQQKWKTKFEDVELIVDEVEEYLKTGDYKRFKRVLLYNEKENAVDSFYFSYEEDMKLEKAFIQTSEKYMELLELEMGMIQDEVGLEAFLIYLKS